MYVWEPTSACLPARTCFLEWNTPTVILYGEKDDLSEYDRVASFSSRFASELTVMEDGDHYFHTYEQLAFLRNWLKETIPVISAVK